MREGERVFFGVASANRDESLYEAPDEFRLDRPKPKGHAAFGGGPHVCPGASLARLEGRIVLEVAVERLAEITLEPGFTWQKVPVFCEWPARLPAKLVARGAGRGRARVVGRSAGSGLLGRPPCFAPRSHVALEVTHVREARFDQQSLREPARRPLSVDDDRTVAVRAQPARRAASSPCGMLTAPGRGCCRTRPASGRPGSAHSPPPPRAASPEIGVMPRPGAGEQPHGREEQGAIRFPWIRTFRRCAPSGRQPGVLRAWRAPAGRCGR